MIIHDLLLVVPRVPLRVKLQCFQACAVGADDRTRGLLFFAAPVMEVSGEILGFVSGPQNQAGELLDKCTCLERGPRSQTCVQISWDFIEIPTKESNMCPSPSASFSENALTCQPKFDLSSQFLTEYTEDTGSE